jgi:hypothetical protein
VDQVAQLSAQQIGGFNPMAATSVRTRDTGRRCPAPRNRPSCA